MEDNLDLISGSKEEEEEEERAHLGPKVEVDLVIPTSLGEEWAGFGKRFLAETSDIYAKNAWDNVEIDPETKKLYESLLSTPVDGKHIDQSNSDKKREAEIQKISRCDNAWEHFHVRHLCFGNQGTQFFRTRGWLTNEWPRLLQNGKEIGAERHVILDCGGGEGSTALPILHLNSEAFVHSFDVSPTAIDALKQKINGIPEFRNRINPFVCDFSLPMSNLFDFVKVGEATTVISLFVLGALDPITELPHALNAIRSCCHVGSHFLFRDHARLDMVHLRLHRNGKQVRFPETDETRPNLYRRHDGTLQYFFKHEEVAELLSHYGFRPVKIYTISRLEINRKTKQKMYRRWVSGEFEFVGDSKS